MRNVWQDERLVYSRGRLSWAWRAAILLSAAALACATAMLMPFVELFASAPRQELSFRPVETIAWRPPPPPPRPPPPDRPKPPVETRPEPSKPMIKPEVSKPPPRPTRLPVKLDFTFAPIAADLALNFEVDPTVEEIPETIVESPPPPPPSPPPPPKPKPSEPDTSPAIISQVEPVYPYRARMRGIEGHVDVLFTVTTSGSVSDPEVVGSSPPGLFDHAALRAITQWRFAPAMRGNDSVVARVQIRIRFALDK